MKDTTRMYSLTEKLGDINENIGKLKQAVYVLGNAIYFSEQRILNDKKEQARDLLLEILKAAVHERDEIKSELGKMFFTLEDK